MTQLATVDVASVAEQVGPAGTVVVQYVSPSSGPPTKVAVQVSVVPVVSVLTVVGSQPDVEVTSLSSSLTVHETGTSEVYQPSRPSGSGVFATMTGALVSAGTLLHPLDPTYAIAL